ncbi:hypothetical protein AB4571_03965 [Vibrio breoganii]|uniref:hypothetical protein n=1 Tax=Vibrio breoganii TaxID=553239 RepID=UPI000C82D3AE|nr:hypothetical protein [Vibrio breoganii]PML10947.1 hypothetical protein BCT84_03540 [Vibrio breoganii]
MSDKVKLRICVIFTIIAALATITFIITEHRSDYPGMYIGPILFSAGGFYLSAIKTLFVERNMANRHY